MMINRRRFNFNGAPTRHSTFRRNLDGLATDLADAQYTPSGLARVVRSTATWDIMSF